MANKPVYRSADRDAAVISRVVSRPAPPLYSIVRYNMCSQQDAEEVWKHCLEDWELSETSQEQREILLTNIAAVFAMSTSKDGENLATTFPVPTKDGDEFRCIGVIDKHMAMLYQGYNDSRLRVFARCFRHGILVVRQYELLRDPGNWELRSHVASKITQPPEDAQYMFDTAEYLIHAGVQLTATETSKIMHYKRLRVVAASESAHAIGEMSSRNDTSGKMSQRIVRGAPQIVSATTADARMAAASGNVFSAGALR